MTDPRPGDPGYREIRQAIATMDAQRARRHEQIMARFEQAQVVIDRTLAEERARAVAEALATEAPAGGTGGRSCR